MVLLHSHALARAIERGTTEQEIVDVVETGERFPAKQGREGFRKTIIYNDVWQGVHYYVKQIECYAVKEKGNWLVISLLVKYF
jgi:hypothetical protein